MIEGQHTFGWLTEPQAVELLFPSIGQGSAMAGSEPANDHGDQAEDKDEADEETTEQKLVT